MGIGTAPPKPRPNPRDLRLTPRKTARAAWVARVTDGNALLHAMLPALAAEARLHGNTDGHTPDILIAPTPGASRVLITFSGNGDELIVHPAMTLLENTHVIAIRDARAAHDAGALGAKPPALQALGGALRYKRLEALARPAGTGNASPAARHSGGGGHGIT